MLKKLVLIITLIVGFNGAALAGDSLGQLENDVIKYCQEMERNRDNLYVRDLGECSYYIQRTYRTRAYIKFLKFHNRYKELVQEERDRIERLERLLNYWVDEE